MEKASTFIGKDTLLAAQGQPLRKKLITVVLDSPNHYAWGGEGIVVDGEIVGELTSVGWSSQAGACVAMGYARGVSAQRQFAGDAIQIELWGERIAAKAWDRWMPSD